MSLINQMLRDLDTRHADSRAGDLPPQLRALPKASTAIPTMMAGRRVFGIVLLMVCVAALFLWLWSPGFRPFSKVMATVDQAAFNASLPAAAVRSEQAVPTSEAALAVETQVAVAAPENAAVPADDLMISMPDLTRALAPEAATKPATGGDFGLRLDQALSLPASFARAAIATANPARNAQTAFVAANFKDKAVTAPGAVAEATEQGAATNDGAAKLAQTAAAAQADATRADTAEPRARIEKVKRDELADETLRSALARYRQGQVDDAVQALRQSLQSHPDQARLRQALLGIYVEQQRLDEALDLLQRGLALQPEQSGWAMAAARILVDRGRPEDAWNLLQQHQTTATQNAEYQGFAAVLLQHLKRPHAAIPYFEAALRLKPQEARWWYALGLALDEDGQAAQALDAYRRAQGLGNLPPSLATALEKRLAR